MMSHEEQQAQFESVRNIESVLNAVKRWWPALTLLCTILGAAISITFYAVTGYYTYDNKNKETYATKQDVQRVDDKLDKLIAAVTNQSLQARLNHDKDSLNAVEIKKTVIENKQRTDNDLAEIKKQLGSWKFSTQRWNKDHTQSTFIPVN